MRSIDYIDKERVISYLEIKKLSLELAIKKRELKYWPLTALADFIAMPLVIVGAVYVTFLI